MLAVLATTGFARRSHGRDALDTLPVVRVSRASFQPETFAEVRRLLDSAKHSLVPALQQLPGCLDYFASIDDVSNTMINVSVWRSLQEAKQLDDFPPMRKLAVEFSRAGVVFERPVANYETLWRL
jgi:hypothetical protein